MGTSWLIITAIDVSIIPCLFQHSSPHWIHRIERNNVINHFSLLSFPIGKCMSRIRGKNSMFRCWLLLCLVCLKLTLKTRLTLKVTGKYVETGTGGLLKNAVFKNFAMFTRKHPCWSLFLTKLQACNFFLDLYF